MLRKLLRKNRKTPRSVEEIDRTPVEIPVGMGVPETLEQKMVRFLGQHQRLAARQGFETFEEANDFEIEEDPTWKSPHEEEKPGQFEEDIALEIKHFQMEEKAKQRIARFRPVPREKKETPAEKALRLTEELVAETKKANARKDDPR